MKLVKKGVLASSAVALGLAGSESAMAVGSRQQDGQSLGTGLAFVDDYNPAVPFQVVSRMQQPTVNSILGAQQGGEPVVDPTDYNGYIVRQQCTQNAPGEFSFVFLREETLQADQTYSFTPDAVFFDNQLNLVEASLQTGGGAQTTTPEAEEQTTTTTTTETTTTTPEETTPADETTTTPETTPANETATTTEEVVVDATETTEGG